MDEKCRAVRTALGTLSPVVAEAFIRSFRLPEEEMLCLLEHEVHKKSIQQISMTHHVSPETVKRRRKSALMKIQRAVSWSVS